MQLVDREGRLTPVLKILTDYPRDDLAHDEVHQALVTACVRHNVWPRNLDVGAIPGLDTVSGGFKTAQLALNSTMGFGHVVHTNCAPRKNIASVKSSGEKIVVGLTKTGVALLIVNAGYALSNFRDSIRAGEVAFFQTSVRHAGSQFRSRDFFPDAMAELAAHLAAQYEKMGPDAIVRLLKARKYGVILKGLSWLGKPLKIESAPRLPIGAVLYVDNFGNIKMNFRHDALRKHFREGDVVAVKIGHKVTDAVMGGVGFSQAEGMLALTAGSSGWEVERKKHNFTEAMLRGGRAANLFGDFTPGDTAILLREVDLQKVNAVLHNAPAKAAERLALHNASDARIIAMLARARLIRDGYDATELRAALKKGTLLRHLGA